ncbi:MAG: hypothetical protein WC091_17840 [Sulfuricellaceae bacterium]
MGKGKNKGKAKPISAPTLLSPPTVHAGRYLSLLKKSLLNQLYTENEARLFLLLNYLGRQQPVDLKAIIPEYLGIRDHVAYKFIESGRKVGTWVPFVGADGEALFNAKFQFRRPHDDRPDSPG